MPQARPEPTSSPVALFVFSNLREQKGGLTRTWLRRLSLFHEAGWETHVAVIHRQPEIDETLAAWRERGWLPEQTAVHHYQRRVRRFRAAWTRPTDDHFTRDDRVADWLDWLVGLLPGVVVFADSPVTYAPMAKMRNPYVGRIMSVHLAHRASPRTSWPPRRASAPQRSIYRGQAGQPKLTDRFLPFAESADAVVALTHRQAEHLAADVSGLAVQVIPNMVHQAEPALIATPRDPLLVVCLGRLDPLKRIDDAMRAVGLARSQVPGLHFAVYGRGPDLDRLLALRDEWGLQDAVSFPGFTDDPEAVLASARASLMTSRREALPLAVAESLAVGTPVLTYDVDYGPAELVNEGVNGRVIPDGAVEQLSAALVDVVTDDAAWSRMSAAGPPAVEHLAKDRVASAWLDLAAKVSAGVPEPQPGLLVEEVRMRRGGAQLLGVAYFRDGRGPQTVRIAGAVGHAEQEHRLVLPDHQTPLPTAGQGLSVTPAEAAFDPGELIALLAGTLGGPEDAALSAQDGAGATVPAMGPGVPPTSLPTTSGVLVVRRRDDGSLGVGAADSVLPLTTSQSRVAIALDGEETLLPEVLSFEASPIRLAPAERLHVECITPGLEVTAGSQLSLVARTDPPRVVGSVELVSHEPTTASARWRGTATVTWDAQALSEPGFGAAARLDLGIHAGRLRTVGTIAGPGRPLPVRLAGGPWVMATSSNGGLMLVPGRALRARMGWALRRLGGGRT